MFGKLGLDFLPSSKYMFIKKKIPMSVAKNSQELCDESGKILNYYVLRPEFNKFSLRYGLHGWAFEGKKKKKE